MALSSSSWRPEWIRPLLFLLRPASGRVVAVDGRQQAGADLLDLPSMIQRYDIIRCAKMVHGDIAVAVAEREVSRVTAAKAADDLLTLQGVQASVVLYRQGNGVSMSGRSLGEINVQVILESLGGGGNATSALDHAGQVTLEVAADLRRVRARPAQEGRRLKGAAARPHAEVLRVQHDARGRSWWRTGSCWTPATGWR